MNIIKRLYEIYLSKKDPVSYARYRGVQVGNNCRLYINDFGSEPFLISIGNNVTITAGVRILTHDGSACLANDEKGRRYKYQRVSIGSNVFIGVNSIIMPGVKIENNVIVGAGSMVTKSIPENSVVAGVPAKIIGDFNSFKEGMLNNYVAESDMDKYKPYKYRILAVVDNQTKPFLTC